MKKRKNNLGFQRLTPQVVAKYNNNNTLKPRGKISSKSSKMNFQMLPLMEMRSLKKTQVSSLTTLMRTLTSTRLMSSGVFKIR